MSSNYVFHKLIREVTGSMTLEDIVAKIKIDDPSSGSDVISFDCGGVSCGECPFHVPPKDYISPLEFRSCTSMHSKDTAAYLPISPKGQPDKIVYFNTHNNKRILEFAKKNPHLLKEKFDILRLLDNRLIKFTIRNFK